MGTHKTAFVTSFVRRSGKPIETEIEYIYNLETDMKIIIHDGGFRGNCSWINDSVMH